MKIFLTVASLCFLFITSNAQVAGCTDIKANNYNSSANENNGSCTYDATTASPTNSLVLNGSISLTGISGSIYWKDTLWAHVDIDRNSIYAIDTTSGSSSNRILRSVAISNATNLDWEDMAQDDYYIYLGDFGNNSKGNRTNLKIYKISKAEVSTSNAVNAEVINFSYSDQTNFSDQAQNYTDFDCESMILINGKIYLFTKQWVSYGTSVYEIASTTAGTYTANKIATIANVGLLTGAAVQKEKGVIALVGYRLVFTPVTNFPISFARYMYLLYDYSGTNFFGGNVRLVNLSGSLKTEAVCFRNADYIHIGSEGTVAPYFVAKSPTEESLSLNTYLAAYNGYTSLPIHSIELHAAATGNNVTLNWDIQSDDFLKSIELQRKVTANENFQTIETVASKKSTFIDYSALANQKGLFYRLKLSDIDNKPTYSKDVFVTNSTTNPVTFSQSNNVLTINIKGNTKGVVQIFQTDGKMYYQTPLNQSSTTIYLNNIKSGINIALVKIDGVSYNYRFLNN